MKMKNNHVETERLIIRPFVAADIEFLDQLHSDIEVMRFTLGRTRSHAENLKYLANLLSLEKDHGLGQRIVLTKQDGRAVGRCGYSVWSGVKRQGRVHYNFDSESLKAEETVFQMKELGYSFLREEWGKGYASEAAAAMRDYGRDILELDQVTALIDQENTASMAVAERIGLKRGAACLIGKAPSWHYSLL